MQGKKYSDEKKEQAYLIYATTGSFAETAKQLGVAKSTVKNWIDAKRENEPDEFEQLRTEKKKDFIDKASEIIEKGLELLDRRMTTALDHENQLDFLIDEIIQSDKEELSQEEKSKLINKIRAIQVQKLGDITTAVGTLYDKRALAKGDSTQNTKVTVEMSMDEKIKLLREIQMEDLPPEV